MLTSQDLNGKPSRVLPPKPDLQGLGPSGVLAYRHWKEFLPKLFHQLKASGGLNESLRKAEERTDQALDETENKILKQGYRLQQAQDTAWELVREEWLLLKPEADDQAEPETTE